MPGGMAAILWPLDPVVWTRMGPGAVMTQLFV